MISMNFECRQPQNIHFGATNEPILDYRVSAKPSPFLHNYSVLSSVQLSVVRAKVFTGAKNFSDVPIDG